MFICAFISSRSSCRPSSMRNTTCSSPSTTSAVTATARPAPKRETWLRHKVKHYSFPLCDVTGSKYQTLTGLSSLLCLRSVGYAWLPLLKDGRVIMNESQISVAANLPAGYLSCQEGTSKVVHPQAGEKITCHKDYSMNFNIHCTTNQRVMNLLSYSIQVLKSNGWMEASLCSRSPLTLCPLSTLRFVVWFVFS